MTLSQTVWAVGCVVAISCGQLLFKGAGNRIEAAGTWFALQPLLLVAIAAVIYAMATLAWINLLRQLPLSSAYAVMALSFVLVPVASTVLFNERLAATQIAGYLLIVAGLVLATRQI